MRSCRSPPPGLAGASAGCLPPFLSWAWGAGAALPGRVNPAYYSAAPPPPPTAALSDAVRLRPKACLLGEAAGEGAWEQCCCPPPGKGLYKRWRLLIQRGTAARSEQLCGTSRSLPSDPWRSGGRHQWSGSPAGRRAENWCCPAGEPLQPLAGWGCKGLLTRWLVTTSLVKSMPSGRGIWTPLLVLSVGEGGQSDARSRHWAWGGGERRAPHHPLPLIMGMTDSCSRVLRGPCRGMSCSREGKERVSQHLGAEPPCPPQAPAGVRSRPCCGSTSSTYCQGLEGRLVGVDPEPEQGKERGVSGEQVCQQSPPPTLACAATSAGPAASGGPSCAEPPWHSAGLPATTQAIQQGPAGCLAAAAGAVSHRPPLRKESLCMAKLNYCPPPGKAFAVHRPPPPLTKHLPGCSKAALPLTMVMLES